MKHHFKDKEIKNLLGRHEIPLFVKPYIPDWCFLKDNTLNVIEYENSSRGCICHVSKYLFIAKNNPLYEINVNIIRSTTHQNYHKQDYILSKNIIELCPNLVDFKFINCIKDLDFILDIKKGLSK